MKILKYIILGIIQGFTEPLPISSSGHIRIIKSIINDEVLSDLNFEIIVNFGSLIGIIILYRKEIISLINDFFRYIKTKSKKYEVNYKYAWMIIVGTIPVTILGLFLKNILESNFTTKFIGLALLFTSFILYLIKDKKGHKTKEKITIKDSIIIGLYQSIALIPGISRSASTIVGCMNQDLTRDDALNYSFMLYIPVSIASFVLGITDIINSKNINNLIIPYFISACFSLIVTYYSAKLFINIIKKGKLIYFSIYCLIVGLIVFIVF